MNGGLQTRRRRHLQCYECHIEPLRPENLTDDRKISVVCDVLFAMGRGYGF